MSGKRVLIVGSHPLTQSVSAQYQAMGYAVDSVPDGAQATDIGGYEALCLMPACGSSARMTDEATLQTLQTLAEGLEKRSSRRPLCHTLLHSQVTLWLLQTVELYQDINERLELYAFTMEDQWAKNLICGMARSERRVPPLDREPIGPLSAKHVHLVLYGWSAMTECLAIHAALTAHYPNYVQNPAYRTRITIIGNGIAAQTQAFIQRYRYLMDHSYYRTIDCHKEEQTAFHRPIYSGEREDFVDVEWEFVDADLHSTTVQQKLELWAKSPHQLLTIALCQAECDLNFNEAFALPAAVYEQHIPVWTYTKEGSLLDKVHQTARFSNVYPFGMDDCGYDVRLPLLQMAKRLNYFYICSYGQQGVPTDMPLDQIEDEWGKVLSFSLRYSNIYNVMTIATKMRSLGHDESDWNRFYALNREEIETISAVEHNRWSIDRLILGFRPPTREERLEIKQHIALKDDYKRRKIHYDLCSYGELDVDKTGQNVRVYDYDLTACIPLIANSYREQGL